MQGDRLRANKVIPGRYLARDPKRALPAVRIERVSAPFLGRLVVALLVDLEPGEARRVGRGGVVNLAHVDHDGAKVVAPDGFRAARPVVGLLVHLDEEVAAGGDLAYSGDALGAADVAGYVGGGDIGDGRVAGLGTLISSIDGGGMSHATYRHPDARCAKVGAARPGLLEEGVASGVLSERSNCDNRGLVALHLGSCNSLRNR